MCNKKLNLEAKYFKTVFSFSVVYGYGGLQWRVGTATGERSAERQRVSSLTLDTAH
jgi:hypothetical protein